MTKSFIVRHLLGSIPALLMLALAPMPGMTAESPPRPAAESPWRLGIALGYGQRSNPLALSDDVTILVDLDIAWFGNRWFFDNGDLGFTLLHENSLTVNLVGRLNSDRVFFSKTDTEIISVFDPVGGLVDERIEVPDRDYAVEAGVELLADGGWGYLQASAHRDVSDKHDGYELYVNYGYGFRKRRWFFEPSFGLSWKSDSLNDYYWGVRSSEANSVFPAYRAGAGLNTHGRFLTSYQLNAKWALIIVAEYERLNAEAARSPIVKERDVYGAYAGFKYRF